MLRRLGIGLLCLILGYFVVAVASYFLVMQFSPNKYDRDMEAVMTSAFFYGPAGSVIAFIGGVIFGGRRRPTVPAPEK
jgi:hypothetical protein